LLIIHSQQDEIIPFDMGQSIFEAAPEPKEMLVLTGDHNGGFLLNRSPYQAAIGKFLERHLGLTEAVARTLDDPRRQASVDHDNLSLRRQRPESHSRKESIVVTLTVLE
jgi:hypothetical protein